MKFDIRNAELYYGDFKALKGINLEIPENKITAFIGPSGCGKSTLLKSLNRMNDLVEGCRITGEFLLDGEDIYGKMDVNLLRKRVGMVFQKPNPFPMSVYDNIAFGPRTNSRKGSRNPPWGFPAVSSSDSALQERSPWSRKSCLWTNRPPHWTRYQLPR